MKTQEELKNWTEIKTEEDLPKDHSKVYLVYHLGLDKQPKSPISLEYLKLIFREGHITHWAESKPNEASKKRPAETKIINGEIKFNRETLEAMMALLRFTATGMPGRNSRDKPYMETILDFKRYVEANSLTSYSIVKCECKTPISWDETIFNVCLTCKGVVSQDFKGRTNSFWIENKTKPI